MLVRDKRATAGLKGLGETMEYLRVQLKVCEGCGGLWFRTQSVEVYGRCCAGKLAAHAKAKPERRGRRAGGHSLVLSQAVMAGGAE